MKKTQKYGYHKGGELLETYSIGVFGLEESHGHKSRAGMKIRVDPLWEH
jgi:hypothetical protein